LSYTRAYMWTSRAFSRPAQVVSLAAGVGFEPPCRAVIS